MRRIFIGLIGIGEFAPACRACLRVYPSAGQPARHHFALKPSLRKSRVPTPYQPDAPFSPCRNWGCLNRQCHGTPGLSAATTGGLQIRRCINDFAITARRLNAQCGTHLFQWLRQQMLPMRSGRPLCGTKAFHNGDQCPAPALLCATPNSRTG